MPAATCRMEGPANTPLDQVTADSGPAGHKRSLSGGLLSKLSFLRASAENNQTPADHDEHGQENVSPTSPKKRGGAMAVAVQQQKTRRRKGSLRKAALLGRGAQREKKELEASPLQTQGINAFLDGTISPTSPEEFSLDDAISSTPHIISQLDGIVSRPATSRLPPLTTSMTLQSLADVVSPQKAASSALGYASTTDEDDGITMGGKYPPLRNDAPTSSGSEGYFGSHNLNLLTRRRSTQKPSKSSPLSVGGLAVSPLPTADADWDYSETEWWGWVVLIVTWVVFVTGMGSCLGVWSWAWDVGETPYAPPELEDDPTLPIVGYYPALIILTAVMAWVWVVAAWVGMKYFRHAKISGD